MKHHKPVTLPHGETEALDHITCDICGAVTQSEWADPGDPYDATWTQVAWQDSRCVLREYDICPACFESRLIPWIDAQSQPRFVVHVPERKPVFKPTLIEMVFSWAWLIAILAKAGGL